MWWKFKTSQESSNYRSVKKSRIPRQTARSQREASRRFELLKTSPPSKNETNLQKCLSIHLTLPRFFPPFSVPRLLDSDMGTRGGAATLRTSSICIPRRIIQWSASSVTLSPYSLEVVRSWGTGSFSSPVLISCILSRCQKISCKKEEKNKGTKVIKKGRLSTRILKMAGLHMNC